MRRRLNLLIPYLFLLGMAALVVWSNVRSGDENVTPDATADNGKLIDPICNMEVNKAWGFVSEYDGKRHYFCAKRCREEFDADPDQYLVERCLVCEEKITHASATPATYLEKTWYLCSETHRDEFKADPAAYFMHRMWGIPDWLYYASIGVVLLVSFLMFEGLAAFRRIRGGSGGGDGQLSRSRGREEPGFARTFSSLLAPFSLVKARLGPSTPAPSGAGAAALSLPVIQRSVTFGGTPQPQHRSAASDRFDLLRLGLIRRMLMSRPTRCAFQLFMVTAFLLIIAAGLFGNQNPALNLAPLLTWTIWWCGLVVLIMFASKTWCYMCPWDAIAGWMERLRFWKKSDDGLGLGMKWPRYLRNIWLATFLFIGLTWIELGFGVTMRPAATAWLAIAMLTLAIVSAFLFDRKSFCRYGCLVGRVSGLYALFGGMEVRARDDAVCKACKTKECIKGSENAHGCPTFEYPGGMNANTYCIQCAECLQACPHQNMTVNLRPWGADLDGRGKPRSDEAYLALLMLAISGFHGLTMTPVWGQLTGSIEAALPLGRIIAFSLGMAFLMIAPIIVYAALVWLSWRISASADSSTLEPVSYREYFIRYAYCVLPIALFYHLAHNLEHLLMEGPKVVKLASDPFGWNWNLFGTATMNIPPLASLDVLWIMQVALVGVGHVYSLWAARKISRRIYSNETAASRGQWPMLIGMIAFSVFSLWLLKQPMEMRTSAM